MLLRLAVKRFFDIATSKKTLLRK